ncbi:MAG: hypothetical protein ABJB16_14720 [Saprospiraceae bacterium]
MKRFLAIIVVFYSISISAQNIVIQEVFYNQPLGSDKFELVNTTAGTINISTWWMCARFNYRQLGSATDIEILQGSLNMTPGMHTKLRIITYNLDNLLSDFGIYIDSNFPNPASMEDFIQYGGSMDVGRGTVAVAKGIWRDMDPGAPFVLDFIPLASAGQSTNFDGSNGGGGQLTFATDFVNGTPTLPISLLTLSGTVNTSKQVDLHWIALDEFNSNKHQIERSTDGQHYDLIGEVNSQNLGASPGYYNFLDETPQKNILLYYRVREVNFDGEEILSSILYVKVKDVPDHKMTISPMPIQNNVCFAMELYWPKEETGQFKIVDMSGKVVFNFEEPLLEGYNIIMHLVNGIDPSLYMMILSNNEDDYVANHFLVAK